MSSLTGIRIGAAATVGAVGLAVTGAAATGGAVVGGSLGALRRLGSSDHVHLQGGKTPRHAHYARAGARLAAMLPALGTAGAIGATDHGIRRIARAAPPVAAFKPRL